MRERHCADARFVWNLAIEQFRYRERRERGTTGRPAPGPAARQKQLAEARQEFPWLAAGSSAVQQQALRDFDRAAQACFDGIAKEPTWRKRGKSEGFCVRDTKVVIHNQQWAQIAVPKLGWVKFKLSRALPVGKLGMARITCDGGGRWHVSFPAPQPAVSAAGGRTGRAIGIDRGVATTIATSDGQMFRAPRMGKRDQAKRARLEREKARRRKGSARRKVVVARIAALHQRVAERRRDCGPTGFGIGDNGGSGFDVFVRNVVDRCRRAATAARASLRKWNPLRLAKPPRRAFPNAPCDTVRTYSS